MSTTITTTTINNPSVNLSESTATALRVVLPIIYILLAILGVTGNLIILQIICANRFRHKSIHLLVCSILFSDLFYIIIFTIVRSVSYAYSNTNWFIKPTDWCKAEMYLLRIFDFVLAYSIVFVCLDRAVYKNSCWFGVRKFRSGISIVISIWVASAYVLIPILFFQQKIQVESYGGYLCVTTDESVTLFWLGYVPRRVLDFIDIIFRTLFPTLLMILLLVIGSCTLNDMKNSGDKNRSNLSLLTDNANTTRINDFNALNNSSSLIKDNQGKVVAVVSSNMEGDVSMHPKRLMGLAFAYAIVFMLCQLPYEIYRCVLLWNRDIETNISYQNQNYDFAVEIPLLLLKLLNRCINPFLFICFADVAAYRNGCCRLWACPCLPGCIGCRKCWCYDCWHSIKFECNHCCLGKEKNIEDDQWIPTGLQTVSTYQYRDGERLVTKQRIVEEFETGIQPYYKNPKRIGSLDENNGGIVNENYLNDSNSRVASYRAKYSAPHEEQRRMKL
jgi:hypothetical protein